MSALSAIEADVADRAKPATAGSRPGGRSLRLVGGPARPDGSADDPVGLGWSEPRASSIPPAAHLPLADDVLLPSAVLAPRRARVAAPPPLRLTQRGRVVVGTLVVIVIAAIALVVGLAAAGGAQAANHGQPRAGYQGMHQVVVRPGQTLWSIASAAEPAADPRDVVQQIMTANALTSTDISAGQVLWIPG